MAKVVPGLTKPTDGTISQAPFTFTLTLKRYCTVLLFTRRSRSSSISRVSTSSGETSDSGWSRAGAWVRGSVMRRGLG